MAQLVIKLNVNIDLPSNKFICQIRDDVGNFLHFFTQNQEFTISGGKGIFTLIYNMPDGSYFFKDANIRLYNGTIDSNNWSNIKTDILISCTIQANTTLPNPVTTTTTVNNTTITTTTVTTTVSNTTTVRQCIEPTSVTITGNFNASINSTQQYTFTKVGGHFQNTIVWTVVGGTIVGSANNPTVTIQWGNSFNPCNLTLSVGCVNGTNPTVHSRFFQLNDGITIVGTDGGFNAQQFEYIVPVDQARPSNNEVVLEGLVSKYILRLDIGGTISHAYSKLNGTYQTDLINKYDAGREVGIGVRSGTQTNGAQGYQTVPMWDTQVWNPNDGGDFMNNGSPVLIYNYNSTTKIAFIRNQFLNFPFGDGPEGQQGYITGVFQDTWFKIITIDGIEVLRSIRRLTTDRNLDAFPEQVEYTAQPQEWPFVHINRGLDNMYFVQSVSGNVTTVNIAQTDTSSRILAENWFAGGSANNILGVVGKDILCVEGRPLGSGIDAVNYMVNIKIGNWDSLGTVYTDFDLVATSDINIVRQHCTNYTASRPNGIPRFDFRTNKRFDVAVQNSKFIREEDMDGRLVVVHTKKQPYLRFPRRLFQASSLSTLYVRMRLRGGNAGSAPTTLYLRWDKPGQKPIDKIGQQVAFTVSQTYQNIAINLTANNNIGGKWSGVISEMSIEQDGPENTAVTDTFWDIEWISDTILN